MFRYFQNCKKTTSEAEWSVPACDWPFIVRPNRTSETTWYQWDTEKYSVPRQLIVNRTLNTKFSILGHFLILESRAFITWFLLYFNTIYISILTHHFLSNHFQTNCYKCEVWETHFLISNIETNIMLFNRTSTAQNFLLKSYKLLQLFSA